MSTTEIPTGTDSVRITLGEDGVAVIKFNRPERRNALHDDMYGPIVSAIERLTSSGEAGCIVVTGEGSAFCAGGDVRDGSGRRPDGSRPTPTERAAGLALHARVAVLLHEAPIVTMAAVNGPAVGAGMSIALACDLRLASERATFIGGWARLGFSGDFGGAWLLTRLVGPSRALDLLVTNAAVDAAEALRIGMVDRVEPADRFEQSWREYAAMVASGPRTAMGLMKANVADAGRLPLSEAVVVEAGRMVQSAETEDHRVAVRAWLAKQPPTFGGSRRPYGSGQVNPRR